VLRKVFLIGIVTLFVAVPAQANQGKELRISGPVVRASATAVSVENRVGDAVLTCTVPARLAEKVAAFKPGDTVRMVCIRQRGRRAELRMIGSVGANAEKPQKTDEKSDEKKPEEKRGEKQVAIGSIAELGSGVIVVQSETGRLACRVPAEKQARLAELKVGDKVKMYCLGNELVALERTAPVVDEHKAGEEHKLYGKITTLSRDSVTVQGEAGSLTCTIPAAIAGRVAEHFVVGDSVRMMCRGSELAYLEKT
jgi:hypothetical protein